MNSFDTGHKVRHGVTKKEEQDFYTVPEEYSHAHCVASDFNLTQGVASVFRKKFKGTVYLRNSRPSGFILQQSSFQTRSRHILPCGNHLYTFEMSYLNEDILKLAVPKLGCGLGNREHARDHIREYRSRNTDLQFQPQKISPARTNSGLPFLHDSKMRKKNDLQIPAWSLIDKVTTILGRNSFKKRVMWQTREYSQANPTACTRKHRLQHEQYRGIQ